MQKETSATGGGKTTQKTTSQPNKGSIEVASNPQEKKILNTTAAAIKSKLDQKMVPRPVLNPETLSPQHPEPLLLNNGVTSSCNRSKTPRPGPTANNGVLQRQPHLGHLFNRQMQTMYAECHAKTQVMLASPRVNQGTEVYLIDSKWMLEFKRIFYPHWLSNQGYFPQQHLAAALNNNLQRTQTPKYISQVGLQLRDEPEIGTLQVSKSSQSETIANIVQNHEQQRQKSPSAASTVLDQQQSQHIVEGDLISGSQQQQKQSFKSNVNNNTSIVSNNNLALSKNEIKLRRYMSAEGTTIPKNGSVLSHQGCQSATAAMQAKIMDQVKHLEPMINDRIAQRIEETRQKMNILVCRAGENQFNHVMRDGLQMGTDFEVISRDQWCLLVKYFSQRLGSGDEDSPIIAPVPLIRSYELFGLGIRTQIEYFMQQFSILFVSVYPHLLKFKQRTNKHSNNQSDDNSGDQEMRDTEDRKDNGSNVYNNSCCNSNTDKPALYNGLFNFFFSNKRTIDKLRFRITQAIQEQLIEAQQANFQGKITSSSIRVWFTDEVGIDKLRTDLVETTSTGVKNLRNRFKLDNGSCIDNLGQNLVDQVFFEKRISYLVVEITDQNKDDSAYLLNTTTMTTSSSQQISNSSINGGQSVDSSINQCQTRGGYQKSQQIPQKANHHYNNSLPSSNQLKVENNSMTLKSTLPLAIFAKCSHCYEIGKLAFNCQCHKVNYCSRECQTADQRFHEEKCQGIEVIEKWDQSCKPNQDARLGLTGIRNLNNSCYLSSSLQCLSHAIGLSQYFLRGNFKEEINYNNPLGTQGKVAIGFAKLMKQLWFDAKESVAPLELKNIIAKFKKQFNNQDQQDSQELLNVLLDGLHEDLNRVKKKPLVPVLESEGNNDVEASRESWKNHLKRNQSVIVDMMHGLYKSTVKCPDCNCVSVTFEPYMNISLPIPEIRLIQKQFFWVPFDPSKRCILYNFSIKSHKPINYLKECIGESFKVNKHSFDIVLIQDDQIRRILPKYELMSILNNTSLAGTTIFAFETDPQSLKESYRYPSFYKSSLKHLARKEVEDGTATKRAKYSNSQQEKTTAQPSQNLGDQASEMAQQLTTMRPLTQPQLNNEPEAYNNQNTAANLVLKKIQKKQPSTGFHRKLQPKKLQVIANLQIVNDLDKMENLEQSVEGNTPIFGDKTTDQAIYEMVFPRLMFLNLDGTLIDAHLDIFRQLSPLFLRYLETRDRINQDPRDYKSYQKRRRVPIPPCMNAARWRQMSLSEQYEAVFGAGDPSRQKLKDLPYFVRIVSRKRKVKTQIGLEQSPGQVLIQTKSQIGSVACVYCNRVQCKGCPLKFDDKISLQQVLNKANVSSQPQFYYEDNRQPPQPSNQKKTKTPQKSKKRTKKGKNTKSGTTVDAESIEVLESDNFEFEILIQFNHKKCWALYSCLNRFIHYDNSEFKGLGETNPGEKLSEGVSIYDCFRQFNRPEKLSQANAWYCNRCFDHKQAVKKIQVYNVPPVLIINLKRFRGNHAKQNTLVNFPINGLDMSEFVVSRERPPNRPLYDLFAVSNHQGQLSAGHYTAYTLNRGAWYHFNDHKVRQCTEQDQIVSSAAYILFYQRRGINMEQIDYEQIRNRLEAASSESNSSQEAISAGSNTRPQLPIVPADIVKLPISVATKNSTLVDNNKSGGCGSATVTLRSSPTARRVTIINAAQQQQSPQKVKVLNTSTSGGSNSNITISLKPTTTTTSTTTALNATATTNTTTNDNSKDKKESGFFAGSS